MLLKFERRFKKELSHALDNEKPNAWNNIEAGLMGSNSTNGTQLNTLMQKERRKKTSGWLLKPVRIFAVVLIFAFSSVSVLAIANQDVRSFLFSAFSNNADAINGTLVGARAESCGFTLTVDAVVPQANSFYLFFTLTDSENRFQGDIMHLEDWSFNVDGNTGWSGYHNVEIKNGKPAYMIFSLADAKKLSGKKTIDFSINSLKLATPKSVTIDIPLDKKDFIPVKGYKINSIQALDGYVNLYMDTDVKNKDFIIDSIKILNKTNGHEYYFCEEHSSQENGKDISNIKKVSEKIDNNMNPDDYVIRVSFLENVKITPALEVQFTAEFNNKALAEIKPKDFYVTRAYQNTVIKSRLQRVTAYQLSINLEFEKPTPIPLQSQQAAVNSQGVSSDEKTDGSPIFASINEPIECTNMFITYEDGTKLQTTLINTEIQYSQLVSTSILLKEPLDLSRKPTLYINDKAIPLYK